MYIIGAKLVLFLLKQTINHKYCTSSGMHSVQIVTGMKRPKPKNFGRILDPFCKKSKINFSITSKNSIFAPQK